MDLDKNESKRTQTCNRSHCVRAAKMPQKMNKTAKFIMLFAFFSLWPFCADICAAFCSFFLSFCVYNFVVRLHLFEVVLYWFCISLWLFFFTFLKLTFLCLWVFLCKFCKSLWILGLSSAFVQKLFFPVIFFIVVLSLLSVFCSFAVIFDHFVVLVEYFYVTFGSLCGRFTHHSQPIFHNIWESVCSLSSFLLNCAFPILGTLFGGTFVPVSNYFV